MPETPAQRAARERNLRLSNPGAYSKPPGEPPGAAPGETTDPPGGAPGAPGENEPVAPGAPGEPPGGTPGRPTFRARAPRAAPRKPRAVPPRAAQTREEPHAETPATAADTRPSGGLFGGLLDGLMS